MILATINKVLINYIPTERKIANYLLQKIRGEKTENETCLKCNWRLHVVHKNEPVSINLIVWNYRSLSHFHLLPVRLGAASLLQWC